MKTIQIPEICMLEYHLMLQAGRVASDAAMLAQEAGYHFWERIREALPEAQAVHCTVDLSMPILRISDVPEGK